MILVEDLTVGFDGSVPILENVSIKIKGSSLVFLIGPNGVGKTSLFKTLVGILPPLKGVIPKGLLFAYLAQNSQVVKEISGLEYVLLGCRHGGMFPSLVQEKRALGVLREMGLDPGAKLNELSGGGIQKMGIARAIFQGSEVLLLDEPFSSLDLKNQGEVILLLQRLRSEGRSLILTTHDLNLALRYGDEIWMIHDKKVHSFDPKGIEEIQGLLGVPLYSYYSSENGGSVWLNY